MNYHLGVTRAPSSILFGVGQRHALGRVARQHGTKTLVCTDERFADSEEMRDALASLKDAGVEVKVFSSTLPELPIESIMACAQTHANSKADSVIGVGGGSCLDMAKFVALLLTHKGGLSDYYGEFKVPGPVIPVIAVPTTSGTGSEVTPVAVVADNSRDLKVGVSSPFLIPHSAICDPELTLSCPTSLTAVAGADALTHAIEAFTAVAHEPTPSISGERVFVGKNILSDYYALNAIREISASLANAVREGSDLEARTRLMLGALFAGLAFGSAGTAAAHAIQYPIGAITNTPHGLGVATLMPYVMRFNLASRQNAFAEVARAMGADSGSTQALANDAIDRVTMLFSEIKIPVTLAELGVPADRLEWVATQSMSAARLINNNPELLDHAGVSKIIAAAFAGA